MALSFHDNVGTWSYPAKGLVQWNAAGDVALEDGDWLFCIIDAHWKDNIPNREILDSAPGDWTQNLQFLGDDIGVLDPSLFSIYRAGWASNKKWLSTDDYATYFAQWQEPATITPGDGNPDGTDARMVMVRGMTDDFVVLWGGGGEASTSEDAFFAHYSPLIGNFGSDSDLKITAPDRAAVSLQAVWGIDSDTQTRLMLFGFMNSLGGQTVFVPSSSEVVVWDYAGPTSGGTYDSETATGRVAFKFQEGSIRVSHNQRRTRRLSVS